MKRFAALLLLIVVCTACSAVFATEGTWICPTCGRECERNFCPNDRTPRPTEKPVHEHAWKSATCTDPKTCTVCGATSGSARGHNWKAETCTDPKTCTVCGATSGSARGHNWKAADCTHPETCTVCGKTTGSALGHAWKGATYSAPETCRRCGATRGNKLSPTPTPKPKTAPGWDASLGEEPTEVTLRFDDGTRKTAYEVNPFNYVDEWDDLGAWSTEKISFGSSLGCYWKLKGTIENCYGIAIDVEITKKQNFASGVGFKVGILNEKKGDYGDYHNEVQLDVGESGTLKCYNKTPGSFNGYTTMTSSPMDGRKWSYNSCMFSPRLYFASMKSAANYVRSIR